MIGSASRVQDKEDCQVSKILSSMVVAVRPVCILSDESKKARHFKKCYSVDIKAMILKTVLFLSRYVKLSPMI